MDLETVLEDVEFEEEVYINETELERELCINLCSKI